MVCLDSLATVVDRTNCLYFVERSVTRNSSGHRVSIWTLVMEMGQRYGAPDDAIQAGSDGIIVGSGIYKSDDPKGVAAAYAEISWQALIERSD